MTLPFLKWAGGKRWLAPKLVSLVDDISDFRLVEPFVGSGAAFFSLQPNKALLADSNPDLMAAFRAVRDKPEELIRRLRRMSVDEDTFQKVRARDPKSTLKRAVRLIYLNKTSFNGLYRVNREGKFNVPFGCKAGTKVCDATGLRAASRALRRTSLRCQDFHATLRGVNPQSDIVYADPPYTVKHDNNGFRRYNQHIFTWSDQEELAGTLKKLACEGARIVVSNAHHEAIRRLYPRSLFHSLALSRSTCMAADISRRGDCLEWLIVSRTLLRNPKTILADSLVEA